MSNITPVRIIRSDAHNWSVQVWQEGGKEYTTKEGGKKTTESKWTDRSYTGKLEFAIKWAIEEAAPIGIPITNDVLKGIEANILKETRAMFAEVAEIEQLKSDLAAMVRLATARFAGAAADDEDFDLFMRLKSEAGL